MRLSLRLAAGIACFAVASATTIAQSDTCATITTTITDSGTLGVVSVVPFSTVGFTVAGPNAACQQAPATANPADGWFRYLAATTGTATFSLCPCSILAPGGSALNGAAVFDSTLSAWADACPPVTALACSDGAPDCGGALQSEMSLPVVAGTNYLIRLGAWATASAAVGFTGNLAIVVNPAPVYPTPPAPPAPIGFTQTLPQGFETLATGFFSATPFGTAYACQTTPAAGMMNQYCWDSSALAYKGAQRINAVSFRLPVGLTNNGGTAINVNISLASSVNDVLSLSGTFVTNRGPDYTLVYAGSITFPAGEPAGYGSANGYWVTVPLTTPFVFDPTLGKDLLMEVQTNDTAQASLAGIEVSFGPARTVQSLTSAAAATGTGLVTAALILLDYTPLPTLNVSNSGPGIGDLTMSVDLMPGTVGMGWTLISTDTTHALDSGPFLGLYPAQTMFDVLALTPSFGNPLAWTTGVPSGFFPTSPFSVAPGTLLFLSGQTWDFGLLCVDAFSFFVRRSNVVRVTF